MFHDYCYIALAYIVTGCIVGFGFIVFLDIMGVFTSYVARNLRN